ncbi:MULTISPECIES: triphosphoribosyl-dephospho-CoA synthase [Methanosarcina]|jgi:triphosphoribosyl-dephospho-CoA synthase|uniref:Fumarate hydratase n=3 Tax=Methanosarcina mazei TaxID=2209 RepID=A0A0F8KRQ3_METMZ|nr:MULTISPECIES: triphosphoribosyl-dephospho-CoA synthase [Methanosarcina]AKB62679.1 Triphosphoribosyl-dephospho-CoA synthetase [Methanosarcina mazei SarPi]AKB71488.1 Triphosphoribosyl-dephospho-CoA synthetase [Methanosarcina mazei C16]KKG16362.1 fumarate hydratase [Methanosarcina mazei]KKG28142.1 fumarate hydratase [Methanosarcina mazei]KKG39688.1 fumarate hydratase [Methanosarcina mazei]
MNPDKTVFSCHNPEWRGERPAPSLIARCAQLAMLLEVSASPKPGNVDREHNYPDTCFEHFVASSVAVYPVFELAAKSTGRIGQLLRSAVYESSAWQQGGNTHFGAFLLLIPLAMAAGEISREQGEQPGCGKTFFRIEAEEFENLASHAHAFVRETDCEDAVEFYRAFGHAGVRVNSVEEFDLEDPEATSDLRNQNITLYSLMEIAKGYDLIANEWTSGFGRCLEGAKIILDFMDARNCREEALAGGSVSICSGTGINEAVVYTFLKLLSKHRDTFIQTKFDAETADYVSSRAGEVLSGWEISGKKAGDFAFILPRIQEFDSELLDKRINPGSTADIIIAALFIALLGGLRF